MKEDEAFQTTIFGTEERVIIATTQKKVRPSKMKEFRKFAGYDNSNECKTCQFCKEKKQNHRKYYKCDKIGNSSSSATDIRLSDHACKFYKKK